jgi:hypothetical protein
MKAYKRTVFYLHKRIDKGTSSATDARAPINHKAH